MPQSIKKFIRKFILLFIVFLTGGAILVLEVLATRVLAVYFGNTIFTVSSVISVILLALSIGYYIGGRLADKKASEFLFYNIILISGVSVLIIQLLNLYIVPKISYSLSLFEGPLLISLLLFFLPSCLLGLLSPIVVTLQNKHRKEGIGKTTGDVFFWSTLGSIIGSLLCGFILIPNFGIDAILWGVGILLITISVFGLMGSGNKSLRLNLFLIILFGTPVFFIIQNFLTINADIVKDKSIIFSKDGVYEKITIYDDYYNDSPARFLRQDLDESSAMYSHSPNLLVYDYSKYFALYKLTNTRLDHALVIGGGAYSVPKTLVTESNQVQVDVVEIEPGLFDIVKKYFAIPDTPRLKNYVEDGRRFLHDTDKKYNLIFTDAFRFTVPSHLTTKEFFKLSKDKLADKGVFVMNIIGSFKDTSPSFALSEIRTFQSIYPNSYIYAVESPQLLKLKQNIMLVGYNSPQPLDFNIAFNSNDSFLRSLPSKLVDMNKFNLNNHKIFTDNYSPVEYYIAKSLVD